MSVAPKIAVTTDSGHVEQEPSHETRRRLKERKTGPDGLDSKDAEGGAALTVVCQFPDFQTLLFFKKIVS